MPLFNALQLHQVGRSSAIKAQKTANMLLNESFSNFDKSKFYDIFLSHSYKDAYVILGLKTFIEQLRYTVYIDWLDDTQLDRAQVTPQTAQMLRERMKSCRSLFYAISVNSSTSVWMPWELGYFDGIKEKVAIGPILNNISVSEKYEGQEYLGLYPYVVKTENTLYIHRTDEEFIPFDRWLLLTNPVIR